MNQLPPLLKNLELVSLTKEPALLIYASDNVIEEPNASSLFKFRCQFVREKRRVNVGSEYLQIERNIFTEGPFQDRFFLKRIERRVARNPRSGVEETNTIAIIEDRSPAKKGDTHQIEKGSRNGKVIRYNTATLRLNVPDERNNEIKVGAGQSFSLPFGQEAQRRYKFAEVDANGQVVIEYESTSNRAGRFSLSSPSTEERLAQQE